MSVLEAARTTDDVHLGELDAEALVATHGSPLFVYDLAVVTRQADALRAVLPARFDIAYAVKANPSLGLVAHLGDLGLGADVASLGELRTAIRAGIPAERIVMTGPGKRDEELRAAVDAGIRAITVESVGELRRLDAIAGTRAGPGARPVPILLRVAVSTTAVGERIPIVGGDGGLKFGMDRDDLLAAARLAGSSNRLDLLGIHSFGASNVTDAATVAEHVAATMALAIEVAAATGMTLRLVDVGGGLGIPYRDDEPPLDLDAFGRLLGALADSWTTDPATRGTRLLIEPGRFIVGACGLYVTQVVDTKTVDGRAVAVVDGGIHHVLRPALVGGEHRVRRLSRRGHPASATAPDPVMIAGPLCSGLDVLATSALLPRLEPGDLLAILDVGAYGFSESMPFFLSHPIPAEIAIHDGRASVLRPRLEPESWLEWQRLPEAAG